MNYLLLLFIELVVLYFLSRTLTKNFSSVLFSIFKNKKVAVYIFSILFLPGTLFHELSHFLAAKLLFVPVGKFNLKPKAERNMITLGSVSIANTDYFRWTLIGMAPFVVGVILVLLPFWNDFIKETVESRMILKVLLLYFIFQISNTMFLSKSDLSGLLRLLIVTVIILLLLYLFKVRVALDGLYSLLNIKVAAVLPLLLLYLLIPIGIDLILLMVGKFVNKILRYG